MTHTEEKSPFAVVKLQRGISACVGEIAVMADIAHWLEAQLQP